MAVFFTTAGCGRDATSESGGVAEESAPAPDEAASASASSNNGAADEKRWFISAANPYAAEAGAEILRQGGSAVDAAVATATVLGLVEPQSSGLGGGAFLLHYDPATGALETYNGREKAPISATPDRFLTETGEPMNFYDAVASGLSVGVPGAVRMYALAHDDHGALAWNKLFDPAIRLSDDGFKVSPRMNMLLDRFPRLRATPEAAAYFYDENGSPREVGYLLKNPEYAQTLRVIAEHGPDAFYEGAIAEAIVDAVNSASISGDMTMQDMADYTALKQAPVCAGYRAYEICSMAPPSSGGVTTLQILAMLEPFDLAAAGAHTAPALHLLFEASKLAYADRNQYLADNLALADKGGLSPEEVIAGLLNPAYLEARAALIDATSAATDVTAGDPSAHAIETGAGEWSGLGADASPEPPSTTHYTIVDGEGRVVSTTATVEFAFGSHLMAAGMILNNELTDFSFLPVRDGKPVANAVAPGKRPRSSMSPVIAFDDDGDFWAALGSPGGPAIIGYVAKTLIALIDWEMSLQDAIDLPNAVYPRGSAILEENGFNTQTRADLMTLGHEITERALTSGVHAVRVNPDGSYEGGADPRREGVWLTGVVDK
ncbi:MAG: gamma-glutamyltransferase [Marinicaulis sp.]|nr:gamma-glutamyltransferase [Marinicaulis sp.]